MNSQSFFPEAIKGIFQSRPNRFIVECIVKGARIRAYLPNPGRLWELLFPGTILYVVRHQEGFAGSTQYSVVAVEREGYPIMLHTHVNNLVARRLIETEQVPGLEGAAVVKPEVTIGRSRFDFLLRHGTQDVVVEVKSCTLFGKRIAMFPDAITLRGTKHLLELGELAHEGRKSAVLFLVHSPRAEYFLPEWHTDLILSQTLLAVKDRVMVKALSVEWKPDLSIGRVKEMKIPWNVAAQEAHDRGSYILILEMIRDRLLSIGGLGDIKFRKGYYLYIGSAQKNLTRRMASHQRLRKKMHWHVDYLRAAADFHGVLPIRTSEDLGCELASAVRELAEWEVPGFGCSDCECGSHLFGTTEDPIRKRAFINLLLYFRMDRLEKYCE